MLILARSAGQSISRVDQLIAKPRPPLANQRVRACSTVPYESWYVYSQSAALLSSGLGSIPISR